MPFRRLIVGRASVLGIVDRSKLFGFKTSSPSNTTTASSINIAYELPSSSNSHTNHHQARPRGLHCALFATITSKASQPRQLPSIPITTATTFIQRHQAKHRHNLQHATRYAAEQDIPQPPSSKPALAAQVAARKRQRSDTAKSNLEYVYGALTTPAVLYKKYKRPFGFNQRSSDHGYRAVSSAPSNEGVTAEARDHGRKRRGDKVGGGLVEQACR